MAVENPACTICVLCIVPVVFAPMIRAVCGLGWTERSVIKRMTLHRYLLPNDVGADEQALMERREGRDGATQCKATSARPFDARAGKSPNKVLRGAIGTSVLPG